MAFLLLEERECLSVFVEASLDAASLISGNNRAILEVNAEIGAEFVLASDCCVSRPVLVVLQEGSLENGSGHLSGTNSLEGINIVFSSWLSHLFLLN